MQENSPKIFPEKLHLWSIIFCELDNITCCQNESNLNPHKSFNNNQAIGFVEI